MLVVLFLQHIWSKIPQKICTTDHSCSDKLLIVTCAMIPTNCATILQKEHTKILQPCDKWHNSQFSYCDNGDKSVSCQTSVLPVSCSSCPLLKHHWWLLPIFLPTTHFLSLQLVCLAVLQDRFVLLLAIHNWEVVTSGVMQKTCQCLGAGIVWVSIFPF